MSHAQTLTAADFETEVLRAEQPVVLDFYATWCMPCRMMGPVLDELGNRLAGKVKILKIDTDAEPELAGAFQVSAVPTLYIVHKGKVVDRIVGVAALGQLVEKLEPLVASGSAAT